METIPLDECKHGYLYRIRARNLRLGVFDESEKGFVGIREKFGHKYLFTEHHVETGPPHGTTAPTEKLEQIPEGMSLEKSLGDIDEWTKRPVTFDRPKKEGGKGWYFSDTKEESDEIAPIEFPNKELFCWVKEKERQYLA